MPTPRKLRVLRCDLVSCRGGIDGCNGSECRNERWQKCTPEEARELLGAAGIKRSTPGRNNNGARSTAPSSDYDSLWKKIQAQCPECQGKGYTHVTALGWCPNYHTCKRCRGTGKR